MGAPLTIAALLAIGVVVVATLLVRATLRLRRLEATVRVPLGADTIMRNDWIDLPESWVSSLGHITITSNDLFWESDASHRYVKFYGRQQAFDGFDLSHFEGKAPWEMPAVGVSAAEWEDLRKLMDGHKPFHDFVVGRIDAHGRLRFGSISGTPVFDAHGAFAGYRAASRHITRFRLAQLRMQISDGVTRALSAHHRLSAATPELLEAVCRPLEWLYGARWMRDPRDNHLVCGEIWAMARAQPLVTASKQTRVPVEGYDPLARAWRNQVAVWVTDARTDPASMRQTALVEASLAASFVVPVMVQGEPVCLLEFFGPMIQQSDDLVESVSEALNHHVSLFWLRREAEVRLTYAATHDALTGLRSRLSFHAELDKGIVRSERNGWRMALLFIDLDGFKLVNDALGHSAGDIVLAEAAKRFKALLRASDTIARLGGDEFIVLLEQAGNDGVLADIANKLVKSLDAPFHGIDPNARVGASVGVAIYPVDATESVNLLARADSAMYKAKNSTVSRVAFYRPPPGERPALNRAPPALDGFPDPE